MTARQRFAGGRSTRSVPEWHHEGVTFRSANERSFGLRLAEKIAWIAGAILLVSYGAIRLRHAAGARAEVRRFERQRTLAVAAPDQSLWAPERVRAWRESAAKRETPLAVLRIPKIALEAPLLEGTSDAALDYGVGHIEDTAPPGTAGNVGIAGHRDGFFRRLGDLAPGDAIELETLAGREEFSVSKIWLLSPDDVWVLDSSSSPELTLVTCYPFYYTGSAPKRYVVRASRRSAAPEPLHATR